MISIALVYYYTLYDPFMDYKLTKSCQNTTVKLLLPFQAKLLADKDIDKRT